MLECTGLCKIWHSALKAVKVQRFFYRNLNTDGVLNYSNTRLGTYFIDDVRANFEMQTKNSIRYIRYNNFKISESTTCTFLVNDHKAIDYTTCQNIQPLNKPRISTSHLLEP